MKGVVKRLKRWLHLGHRWLGIATALFIVTWFVSGLVMLAVGFPALTEAERVAALGTLRLDAVRLTPQGALERSGSPRFPPASPWRCGDPSPPTGSRKETGGARRSRR